jgi:hypothetical protein
MLIEAVERLKKYKLSQLPNANIDYGEILEEFMKIPDRDQYIEAKGRQEYITMADLPRLKWAVEETTHKDKYGMWNQESIPIKKFPFNLHKFMKRNKSEFHKSYRVDWFTGKIYHKVSLVEGTETHISVAPQHISDIFKFFEEAPWGDPVFDKSGMGTQIAHADLNDSFWSFYRGSKGKIKERGFNVARRQGEWVLIKYTYPELEPEPEPEDVITLDSNQTTKVVNESILYDYQKTHTIKLVEALRVYGSALDGSSTGTGKTFSALVVAKAMGYKVFVICPKPTIPGWLRSVETIGVESVGVVNYALIREGKHIAYRPAKKRRRSKVTGELEHFSVAFVEPCPYVKATINPDTSKYAPKYIYDWNLPEKTLVVGDEFHRTKNRGTLNSAVFLAGIAQDINLLMLSATIGENPLKMITAAKALGFYDEPWEFYTDFCANHGCSKTKLNPYTGDSHWEYCGGIKVMKQLHDEIYGVGKGSRMDSKILVDRGLFPTTKIVPELIQFENEAELTKTFWEMKELDKKIREYRKDHRKGAIRLDINKAESGFLQLRQKLRQKAELLKVPGFVKMAKAAVDEGQSVVIFVNYTASVRRLAKMLDTNCIIAGFNNAKKNEANRLAFEENQEYILICNIAAAKEGIDLHDKYHLRPRITIINPDDYAEAMKQVFGRVQRAGGTPSVQYIVFAHNTIEERVYYNVNRKILQIDTLNDGDMAIALGGSK